MTASNWSAANVSSAASAGSARAAAAGGLVGGPTRPPVEDRALLQSPDDGPEALLDGQVPVACGGGPVGRRPQVGRAAVVVLEQRGLLEGPWLDRGAPRRQIASATSGGDDHDDDQDRPESRRGWRSPVCADEPADEPAEPVRRPVEERRVVAVIDRA